MSQEIYNLRDISEVESNSLNQLLQLEPIEQLFVTDSYSMIGHYATQFGHFKTLLQLLTWSFADIMEHFRMGALTDFSIDQLVHLVKALFSDTPLRKRNIDELCRSLPEK